MEPIKPTDVEKLKTDTFPAEVFEAFNELIAKNYSNGEAVVEQKEVVKLIKKKLKDAKSKIIFDYDFLNIEEVYEEAGWTVNYDKPGYCEDYEATFTFEK